MTETTILVVDDDPSIVELLRDFLENDGFRVESATNGPTALTIVEHATVDCIILDVMMPGQTGFELCKQIRATSEVPILFLSARDEDVNKIRGLGIGGDDYIVKTASPGEVVARVKAVLRRTSSSQESDQPVTLAYGRLVLNLSAREVTLSGEPISLTPKEYDLLRLLAEHPRQVFTYDHLLNEFWDGVGSRHTVRVHIARIRDKIEQDPNEPEFIVNVWGVGYRFEGMPR